MKREDNETKGSPNLYVVSILFISVPYKEAKETTNQLKPVLIKAGIDLSGIGAIDLSKLPDWQKQIVSDYKKGFRHNASR